jgi:Protein of unknown function (DUF3102)
MTSETLKPLSTPSSVPAISEAEMVKRINDTYATIERATRETVPRAINLGEMLVKAKADYGAHGKWGNWLKLNCSQLSERTAQTYMELANDRPKLEAELAKRAKSATAANLFSALSLRDALGLIKGDAAAASKGSPSDAYDNVEAKLIDKLKKLKPEEAEIASDETIKALKKTVSEMKQIAKNVTEKAA